MSNAQLKQYQELLLKWNEKINLISPSSVKDLSKRHIEDSLQILNYLPDNTDIIIDLGSGGGLPGIPLAAQTGIETHLIESDSRKCVFLSEAAREMGLNVKVHNERIEKARINLTNPAANIIITARALANLKKLLGLVNSFIENNGIKVYTLILHKGENVSRETLEAKTCWSYNLGQYGSVTNKNSHILVINNLTKKETIK